MSLRDDYCGNLCGCLDDILEYFPHIRAARRGLSLFYCRFFILEFDMNLSLLKEQNKFKVREYFTLDTLEMLNEHLIVLFLLFFHLSVSLCDVKLICLS